MSTALVISSTSAGLTYAFVGTTVWGSPAVDAAAFVAVAPVPPVGLRKGVAGPYGLLVDFDDEDSVLTLGVGTYPISWTLPTCTVVQTAAADAQLEKAECSNRGVCDRTLGQCACFAGYSGSQCSQQTIVI